MPQLSCGSFCYGSADHDGAPDWQPRRPPSFHTDDRSAAVHEMIRRANRWGGNWCVYPHPYYRGEYAVALEGLLSGDPVARIESARCSDTDI
jgi:hypothetical protein